MVHVSPNTGPLRVCKWSRHGRGCLGEPGTVVVKWEAEKRTTGALEKTFAHCDCMTTEHLGELWIAVTDVLESDHIWPGSHSFVSMSKKEGQKHTTAGIR